MNVLAILIFCYVFGVQCEKNTSPKTADCLDKKNPRVLIIGAGPSGIAAASRLLQNGLNVTILEAEGRKGGRVYSVPFGEYMIDMGGQWVQGQAGNPSFEMASPLGLLERSPSLTDNRIKLFGSSGPEISSNITYDMLNIFFNETENLPEDLCDQSFGEYTEKKLVEYFKNHPEIDSSLQTTLINYFNLMKMTDDVANSWYELPLQDPLVSTFEGAQYMNWKERTYGTILDILTKKYPNPEEELPVENNTLLNTKVTKINYIQPEGVVKVSTENGKDYEADHVILTVSLGVLKNTLFDLTLPERKINAIQNIDYGHSAKIYLYYDTPWWLNDGLFARGTYWTAEDKKKLENDPTKKWIQGVSSVVQVEHKPKLLCMWLSTSYATEMEHVPEDLLRNHVVEFLNKFFSHSYNVTEPTLIKRSSWNTNENFRGTYSVRTLKSMAAGASFSDLAEPIIMNGKPVLQFAGEATSPYWGTVHGAILSGWREADRLISLYTTACKK